MRVGAVAALMVAAVLATAGWLASPAGASGAAPSADAGGPYTIAEGDDVTLSASASTDPEGDTLTYRWDLDGDGQYDDAVGEQVPAAWAALAAAGIDDDGSYTVAVEVDDGTSTSTDSASLTVTDTAPTVALSGPSSAAVGSPYRLDVAVDDPGDDTISAWVVSWGDGEITTGSGQPGTLTHTYDGAGLSHGILVQVTNEDGTWTDNDLVVAFQDASDKVSRFDVETGSKITDFPSSALTDAYDVVVGPDGLVYATGGTSNNVIRYDPADNTVVGTFVTGGPEGARGLAFGPDGNLYVVDFDEAEVLRFDGTTGASLGTFASSGLNGPRDLIFTPDGRLLVSDGNDDVIRAYDADTGASLGVLVNNSGGDRPVGMAIGPDGDLYVALYGPGSVAAYDLTTGAFVRTAASTGLTRPHSVAFGPDGELWVSEYWNEQIRRYDAATGAFLDTRVTEPTPAGPMGLAFLPSHRVSVQDALVVNSTGDATDATPGDGTCDTGGTNAAAQPECTLRAAITEANALAGARIVHLDIPAADSGHASGMWTITPATALPAITAPLVIDGTTQSGTTVNTTAAPGAVSATLTVALSGSSLGAADHGLHLAPGSDGSEIRGLAVIDVTGASAQAIRVEGIEQRIVGNHLGLSADGGTEVANRVGVAVTGTASAVTIGGTDPADRNLFGTQSEAHLLISGSSVTGAAVVGNDFGRLGGGTAATTGPTHGILIEGDATGVTIGGDGTAANRIAGAGTGAAVTGPTTAAAVIGNHINDNTGLGIDLGADGVTANDGGDTDTGPNDLLNAPEPTAAGTSGSNVDLVFSLDVPAGSYRIDAFANPGGTDPSGRGEGETPAGSAVISHPGGGAQTFTVVVSGAVGDQLTTTATEVTGSESFGATSEYSAPIEVGTPSGRWRLDEGAGTTAEDSSGRDVDGTITGAGYTAGVSGTALDFSGGAQERIVVPHQTDGSLDPGAGDFSVELWFANDEIPPTSNWRTLLYKQTGADGYELFIGHSGGSANLVFQLHESGSLWKAEYSGSEVSDGVWHHAAGVVDGGTVRLYLDGVEVDAAPYGATSSASGFDLTIGALAGSGWSDYEGRLDEVALYSRALTPTEIAAAYAALDTIVVNSTADDDDADPGDGVCHTGSANVDGAPACTLRAAITEANATSRIDRVEFALSATDPGHSSGTWLIEPASSALPVVTAPVTVDATTQPGWTDDPVVRLDGSMVGTGDGLRVATDNSTVRGLSLTGWAGRGLHATGSTVTIAGNWFGVTPAGVVAANGDSDLVVEGGGADVIVGGSDAADRNLFTGAGSGAGVMLNGSLTTTTVRGNWFGFLPDGVSSAGSSNEMVVVNNSVDDTVFADNRLGFSGAGGLVYASTGSIIVTGNTLGLATDDTAAPVDVPVRVVSSGPMLLGGTDPADANTIANAGGDGVRVESSSARVTILGNSIHASGQQGIDLGNDGVTTNDAGDGDSGANDLLNTPVITATSFASATVTVDFDLDVPAGNYRIEAFTNPSGAGTGGVGEGEVFAAATSVTHAGGSASYQITFAGSLGAIVALTATEDLGGGTYGVTSEFSAVDVLQLDLVVNATGDDGDTNPGDGVCDTGGVNSGGSTACTLRAAVEELNGLGADGRITFALPTAESGHAGGVWTIRPTSDLPAVDVSVTIDATSQTGWTDDPIVALDGSGGATGDGLELRGASSTVRGLVVHSFPDDGIELDGTDVTVAGSWIGLAPDGTSAGNGDDGIFIATAATGAVLGGAGVGDGNVIAGNGDDGIRADGDDVTIQGNYIGTDPTGLLARPNGDDGLAASGTGTVIADNVISANSDEGIDLTGAVVTITGNLVGGGADGTTALGNAGHGVRVAGSPTGLTTIGGTAGSDGNTMAHNGGDGVMVIATTADIAVLGNTIFDNGGLGIDLGDDGPTANDGGDGDTGPNDLLNTPVVTGIARVGDQVQVSFELDAPAGTYRIEAFTNPGGTDGTGYGEGEQFVAASSITHGGTGAASYQLTYTGSDGDRVTLTTTRDDGGGVFGPTSEFSARAVVPAPIGDLSIRRSDLLERTGGGLTTITPGAVGEAFEVPSGARLQGSGLDVTAGALAVGASVRPDTLSGARWIVSKRTGSGTAIYELGVDGSTGEAVAVLGVGGGTTEVRGGALTTGTWHALQVAWDGTDVVLYVDGVEVDRAAATGALATDPVTRASIGSRADGSQRFDGAIDTVRIGHAPVVGAGVAARHRNQSEPGVHVTLGEEQTAAPGAWTVDGTQARSGAVALSAPETASGAPAWALATGVDERGLVFRSWWWISDPTATIDLAGGVRAGSDEQHESAVVGGAGWELRRRDDGSTSVGATASGPPTAGTWVQVEQWTDQDGQSRLLVDGTEVMTWTDQAGAPESGSAGLRAGALPSGENWYVDDVRLRRLVRPEPSVGVGALDRN